MLLLWAEHRTAFADIVVFWKIDESADIVVFWKIDESFYTRRNQDFLSWFAERRALDKLPFPVVLLGPYVGRRRL
jgi:hypothetical protein